MIQYIYEKVRVSKTTANSLKMICPVRKRRALRQGYSDELASRHRESALQTSKLYISIFRKHLGMNGTIIQGREIPSMCAWRSLACSLRLVRGDVDRFSRGYIRIVSADHRSI